ncbi:MAG: HAD family hydrolase [Planctomycetota bacterium]|jgi:Cof subfamily protein (haloacid dehalogenase superfamily)|nr:HAD family hydrolase [Planctomycetota bacterium]
MEFTNVSDSGVSLPIRPRGIAFDLDGTLLDYDGRLDQSVARSVRLISRSGIKVFLVTGRQLSACERFWRELDLSTPLATCNGAWVGLPSQDPFLHIRLAQEARDAVLGLEDAYNLYVNYYIDNRVYTFKDVPEREWYSRRFSLVEKLPDRDCPVFRRLPTKCLCIAPENERDRFFNLFAETLEKRAGITSSNNRFIEILPLGVDKAVGLKALSEWSGIHLDNFIAVGDAMNDLPMLNAAGFSITFKSGDHRLADQVDMVLPPLWEDGADFLARCILGLSDSGRFLTPRSRRFVRK